MPLIFEPSFSLISSARAGAAGSKSERGEPSGLGDGYDPSTHAFEYRAGALERQARARSGCLFSQQEAVACVRDSSEIRHEAAAAKAHSTLSAACGRGYFLLRGRLAWAAICAGERDLGFAAEPIARSSCCRSANSDSSARRPAGASRRCPRGRKLRDCARRRRLWGPQKWLANLSAGARRWRVPRRSSSLSLRGCAQALSGHRRGMSPASERINFSFPPVVRRRCVATSSESVCEFVAESAVACAAADGADDSGRFRFVPRVRGNRMQIQRC